MLSSTPTTIQMRIRNQFMSRAPLNRVPCTVQGHKALLVFD